MNNRALGLKIASLTLATIMLASTMSIALAQDAEARGSQSLKWVDTKNNGFAIVCAVKAFDLDPTETYTVNFEMLDISTAPVTGLGSFGGLLTLTLDASNPTHFSKVRGVDVIKAEFDVGKQIITAKVKALNLDRNHVYFCAVDITHPTGSDLNSESSITAGIF